MKHISICQRADRRRAFLLTAFSLALAACATSTEQVPASYKNFWSGAQSDDLSERERLLCEKKASEGDIVAAKRLVTYHTMVTTDSKQIYHWLGVVARLQKARAERMRGPHLQDRGTADRVR
jgi:hypothetical protein